MKRVFITFTLCCTVFLTGCVTSFQYGANELKTIKPVPAATQQPCFVETFVDARGNPKNKNTLFQTWIPLVPYGEKESFYPEQGNVYIFVGSYSANVATDLTNAAIMSLKKSGVFSSVSSAPTPMIPRGYTLQGQICNFSVKEYMTTYCLSFFGSLLYFVGLPSGSSTNRIGLDLTLKDNATNAIVWSSCLYDEKKMLLGLYYNSTRELGAFPEIYANLMNQAATEISDAIKKYEISQSEKSK